MKFVVILFFCCFSWIAGAQTKAPARAQTVDDDVLVFEKPDSNSKVIGKLPGGKVFDVSSKPVSGTSFFRLRVKPGVVGYVLQNDVKLVNSKRLPAASVKSSEKPKKSVETKSEKRKKRPFQYTQYVGLQYAQIQYQEDTMGDKRKEDTGFFGVKISGPNLILEGAIPTEMNFLFHSGAPSYYEKLTGKSADGWIFIGDFLLQNYFPQGPNDMFIFGFGPMFKYSKFNVTLADATTGKNTAYSLEDMSLGVVLSGGVGLRLGSVALRGELTYYWEKAAYLGAALGLQFGF